MIKKLLYITALLTAISCEEKTTWDIEATDEYLVADCILTNELKNQELILTRSDGLMNHEPVGVSGALVEIYDGIENRTFEEDSVVSGKYVSVVPFRATAGTRYRLTITCNERSDTAYAEMVGITPVEPFEITATDSFFRFIYIQSEEPSMTEVYYDWSADADYCLKYGANQAMEVFYTLNTIDVNQVFSPERQIIEFPRNTQIIRRKYSLSEDHREFIRSLLLETEWRGGLFDVEQGNVPTNFSHGIKGWFAVCMVVGDTTWYR